MDTGWVKFHMHKVIEVELIRKLVTYAVLNYSNHVSCLHVHTRDGEVRVCSGQLTMCKCVVYLPTVLNDGRTDTDGLWGDIKLANCQNSTITYGL